MKSRPLGFDHAVAVIMLVVGVICLFEAMRLLPFSNSLLSGDHALPGITGAAMIILGLILFFTTEARSIRVRFPERPVVIRLVVILGILTIYSISIKPLGYLLPTGLCGIPLFRMFGGYTWGRCTAISIICTAGLYTVFVFGLGMSFPRGLF